MNRTARPAAADPAAIRSRAGISLRTISTVLGVSVRSVWGWENGRTLPPPRAHRRGVRPDHRRARTAPGNPRGASVNRTAAILAAAAFTAGYIARSEVARRRRPSPSAADKLRAAIAADGASAWTWSALRRILAAAEHDDRAEHITVSFSSPHGGSLSGQMRRGQAQPELMFLSATGTSSWSLSALEVPDDASGLGGAG